ncbi:hypothetical protein [Deinococcus soli (ex Cha et al. 2016)]|uniref:Lipoprotein n=1 Tax=Deinococcus soli (ex Cha et al. 2016) TaxID=1309411 RepID=A0A0F7JP19_9DEIO|nr:hypothetical protein [Deinococcus soli (ex Cha et al. 2016)]AKH16370.1 hypothetical protein SY84_04135 [Deinococcus soli (ex Cha et al. 2016)]
MKRVTTVVAGLGFLLAACGETPPAISVGQDPRMLSGHWVGSVRASAETAEVPLDLNFTATYVDAQQVTVTGSGTLDGQAVTLSGTLKGNANMFVQYTPPLPKYNVQGGLNVAGAAGDLGTLNVFQYVSGAAPASGAYFRVEWKPKGSATVSSGSISRR